MQREEKVGSKLRPTNSSLHGCLFNVHDFRGHYSFRPSQSDGPFEGSEYVRTELEIQCFQLSETSACYLPCTCTPVPVTFVQIRVQVHEPAYHQCANINADTEGRLLS